MSDLAAQLRAIAPRQREGVSNPPAFNMDGLSLLDLNVLINRAADELDAIAAPSDAGALTLGEQQFNGLHRLLQSAKMLQNNAVGCAHNHHGHDFQEFGMPGWLADTHTDIFEAEAILAALKQPSNSAREGE